MPKPKKPPASDARGKADPSWRIVERVVAMLERSITPGARVLHDVKLPDIRTGHLRQCDVVIESGTPPRTTLTIVEVQKRKSKVSIGMFQGWWQKMQAVGAQHLICVSAADFPRSIKDEVTMKLGPSVRLLRLRELERDKWPIKLVSGSFPFHFPKITLDPTRHGAIHAENVAGLPQLKMSAYDPVFRRTESNSRLSLDGLLKWWCRSQRAPMLIPVGRYASVLSLGSGVELWVQTEDGERRVQRFELPVIIDVNAVDFPISMSAYEQIGHGATLAWAATGDGVLEGQEMRMRLIFRPQESGGFKISDIEIENAPSDVFFVMRSLSPAGGD